jgi:alpha-L-rhamnosidase
MTLLRRLAMNKTWKAKWIMDEDFCDLSPINIFHKQVEKPIMPDHREDLKNRHMLVRKVFNVNSNVEKAEIHITADDYYKLFINDKFVGQGPAPGYYFNYYYNSFDISSFLKEGENVIAIHVYYQGLINRVWNSGDYRQGMIAELFLNHKLYLCSDNSWKYTGAEEFMETKTIGYDTQYLENIDESLKLHKWRTLEYDDSCWKQAVENTSYDYEFYAQTTANLQVYEVKPEKITVLAEGHYLIDFGQEITGQFKMEASGEKGQIVEIRCGEELQSDMTSVRHNMRCNCNYQEFWTLSGGKDILEHYDYKAFRYVEVLNGKNALKAESFSAIVRHYPFNDEGCKFSSSDVRLNSIWNICKNGVKYGTQEIFVDCPSREKGQYLGDFTVTSHSHAYLTGDLSMYRKALKDFALSSFICPGLMALAPGSLMQEIADFSLQFPLQLLNYYKQSGDIDFLREMYPLAEKALKYFDKYKRKDGLLENVKEKWNLVDWPANLRDGYDFDLSTVVGDGCHNVVNAFYCGAVKTLNEIRDTLKVEYQDEFEDLKEAYIKAFYRKDIKLFKDSTVSNHTALHSNIIALFYELVPVEGIAEVVQFIENKRLSCGVYNSYFLLKGLTKAGAYDTAYKLITCEDENSWYNMVREGATTCFEAWGKDRKWNTSLCHPWASAPIPVIIEDVLGLTPAEPGWKSLRINPQIPQELEYICVEINVRSGKIKFEYKEGKVLVVVPAGVEVEVQNKNTQIKIERNE